MKKIIISVVSLISAILLISCSGTSGAGSIFPISREDGSGTRSAFVELFGIEVKNDAGEKVDRTLLSAEITQSTAVMMTTVAGNKYSIGYVSMGSLSDTVKAVAIDGAEPTANNIKNGTYKISRPLNIVTKETVSAVTQDFISFMLSDNGQMIVEEAGYIRGEGTGAYNAKNPSGKITIAGSSSVTPVMEKLKEAYSALNPNAIIEILQNDSSTGISSAADGTCDIGMASRELKSSEAEKGIKSSVIATDGIAVIVNKENTVTNLTTEQVMKIYTGEIEKWDDIS